MPTSATLDFERLLAPINEPPGETNTFADLKSARKLAANEEKKIDERPVGEDYSDGDPIARDAQGDPVALEGHWKRVRELAEKMLAEETKDLGAAAHLIEALLRSDGFAGLRDALRLTRQIVETSWDDLFPAPADPAQRPAQIADGLGLLASLNGRDREGALILPLRRQPLTEASETGPFTLGDYKEAERLAAAAKDAPREKGVALRAEIEREVSRSSSEFLISLRDDLQECLDEFNSLTSLLQEKSGLKTAAFSLAFPSSNIENVLKECLKIAQRNAEHRVPAAVAEAEAVAETAGPTAANAQAASGTVQNREGALRTLESLARFFEQTDPHSPLAPALRQIVRWARTPLHELYAELVPDEDSRKSLFKLIGVKMPENDDRS